MSRLIRPLDGKKTPGQSIKEWFDGVCQGVKTAWMVTQHMLAGIGLLFMGAFIIYTIHYPDVVRKAIFYPEAIRAADFTITLQDANNTEVSQK